MTTLLEDLRLALREICGSIGLSRTATTVVPLIVLGLALNVAALSVTESMHHVKHPAARRRAQTAWRSAARTEMKVMKCVVISTLKKMGTNQKRLCRAQQWMVARRTQMTGYDIKVGVLWAAPGGQEGCDVTIAGSPVRKIAIAVAQC
jgi:hypothetical protein